MGANDQGLTADQQQELDDVYSRARQALKVIEGYDQARVDRLCQAVALRADRRGEVRRPNLPFNFSSYDITPRGVAPTLGEHNVEVATELGFSDDDIAAMESDGVLFAARDPA